KSHPRDAPGKNQLLIWDLDSGGEPHKVSEEGICGGALDFSPNSRLLVFGQCNRSIHLFDPFSHQDVNQFIQGAYPDSIAVHPDGRYLALSSSQQPDLAVQVLDLYSGDIIKKFSIPKGVSGIAWSDDGHLLAAAGTDYHVYIWDIPGLQPAMIPDQPLAVL